MFMEEAGTGRYCYKHTTYVWNRLDLVVNLCSFVTIKKLAVSPERYSWPGEYSGTLETRDGAAGTYVPVN